MGLSSLLLKFLAKKTYAKHSKNKYSAIDNQRVVFEDILSRGCSSVFAKKIGITKKMSYQQFEKSTELSLFINPYSGFPNLSNLIFPYKPQMDFFIISKNKEKNRPSFFNLIQNIYKFL